MSYDYIDKGNTDGTVLGQSTASKVGFFGVDPVAQASALSAADSCMLPPSVMSLDSFQLPVALSNTISCSTASLPWPSLSGSSWNRLSATLERFFILSNISLASITPYSSTASLIAVARCRCLWLNS